MTNERVRNMIQFKSTVNFKNEKTNLVVGVFSDTTHPLFLQLDKALNKVPPSNRTSCKNSKR